MSILQTKFIIEIAPSMQKELQLKNAMAVPRLKKIVVSMGVKDAVSEQKHIEKASGVLTQITGQKPRVTKAKKSIAAFKLREGQPIGLVVTLRGKRMYDFFEKLTVVVLPRLRDFHGMSKTYLDGHGNYSFGFSEFTVFPEIDPGNVDRVQGLEITIVTNAKDDVKGERLLSALGMPFKKVEN